MAASKPNLADLVAQLPETDLDIEAAQKSPPAAPGRASKFTGPDPAKAEAIFGQVLGGGPDSLAELIGLIQPPGEPEFRNYKAEYLLHALVIHVGRPGQETSRAMLVRTLASQLSANAALAKPVRAFLARELQLVADATAAPALGAWLLDEELCDPAAAALTAIGDGAPAQLRAALPKAKGRCRLAILQSLGALRDQPSLTAFQEALGDADDGVRCVAAWALARLGSPAPISALLKAADVEAPFERIKITQACMALAETLARAGKTPDATRIYSHLLKTRTDPKEAYLRDAAKKALDKLVGSATS